MQNRASVGSRSTMTHRGTCFPAPVSEKNLGVWIHGFYEENTKWLVDLSHTHAKDSGVIKHHSKKGWAWQTVQPTMHQMVKVCKRDSMFDMRSGIPKRSTRTQPHARWVRKLATCWKHRLHHRLSCQTASDHLVGCHAPSRKVPSKHCRSAHLQNAARLQKRSSPTFLHNIFWIPFEIKKPMLKPLPGGWKIPGQSEATCAQGKHGMCMYAFHFLVGLTLASFVVKTRFYCLIGRPKGYRIPELVLKKNTGQLELEASCPPISMLCLKGDFKKKGQSCSHHIGWWWLARVMQAVQGLPVHVATSWSLFWRNRGGAFGFMDVRMCIRINVVLYLRQLLQTHATSSRLLPATRQSVLRHTAPRCSRHALPTTSPLSSLTPATDNCPSSIGMLDACCRFGKKRSETDAPA